jgi:hypothetical protein
MKYDHLGKPEFINLTFEIRNPYSVNNSIERTGEHTLRLLSRFIDDISAKDKTRLKKLSPSAINTWLTCRMMFYYRYVNDLKETDNNLKEIDPAKLGTMLHEIMKNIWTPFIGRIVDVGQVDSIISDKQVISQVIIDVIDKKYEKNSDSSIAANEKIVRNVLTKYISRVLEIDRKSAPFKILGIERPVLFSMNHTINSKKTEVRIGGVIDRIDQKDGIIRIVDYKTGKTADSISSVSALFDNSRKKDADAWLQTLLYCEGYLTEESRASLTPSVYKIRKVPLEKLTDKLIIKKPKQKDEKVVDDYLIVREEFLNGLKDVVKSIFSEDEPFVMISGTWQCRYCPYRILCMK